MDTHEIIQEGTDQSAGHFNNMEHGISDAHLAAALLVIQSSLTADQVATEEKTVTLTNTQRYPFNSSTQTIALSTVMHSALRIRGRLEFFCFFPHRIQKYLRSLWKCPYFVLVFPQHQGGPFHKQGYPV